MKIEIIETSPFNEEIQALFNLLDQHHLSLCSAQVCHLAQPEELNRIKAVLLGIYCDGVLCGMGGLKFYDEYAEVTRMFVKENHRGKGLATMLMKALEEKALEKHRRKLRLETSENFKNAVRLYLKLGFKRCAPFGEYIYKPYNSYMEKSIG